jgi:hypothetical protein
MHWAYLPCVSTDRFARDLRIRQRRARPARAFSEGALDEEISAFCVGISDRNNHKLKLLE